MTLDLALAYDEDSKTLILHRADCSEVRKQAAEGKPVLSMFDCQRKPDDSIKQHSCLRSH